MKTKKQNACNNVSSVSIEPEPFIHVLIGRSSRTKTRDNLKTSQHMSNSDRRALDLNG